jgi:hypothetical protein
MTIKKELRHIYDYLRFYYFPVILTKQFKKKIDKPLAGKYVVATTKGLYLIDNDSIYLLISGNGYGLTKNDTQLYYYQNFGFKGRVITLELDSSGNILPKAKVLNVDLPKGCHQMDLINNRLLITDTYNNRIIDCDLSSNNQHEYYPLGKLTNGRNSENYGHINSLYHSKPDNGFYLFCHNETLKTGRKSSILFVDETFTPQHQITTEAVNGHNICQYDGSLWYCDSENKTLVRGKEVVHHTEHYSRGLSISDEFILIGGSEYKPRKERSKSLGSIDVIDRNFNPYHRFDFPGPVQEIRKLDGTDYGLSESSN